MSCPRLGRSRLELRLLSQGLKKLSSSSPSLPPPPSSSFPARTLFVSSSHGNRQFSSPSNPELTSHRPVASSSSTKPPNTASKKPILQAVGEKLAQAMPTQTAQILINKGGRRMADSCLSQAEYTIDRKAIDDERVEMTEAGEHLGQGSTIWHTSFDLPATFSTWVSVGFLHAYLLHTRLRAVAGMALNDRQTLVKSFNDEMFLKLEVSMDMQHGMRSHGARQRNLKYCFEMWRGSCISYDEGLVKGDAVLAAAVWRNIYRARPEVDVANLANIVAYMRAVLFDLDSRQDEDVFMYAEMAFGRATANILRQDSASMPGQKARK